MHKLALIILSSLIVLSAADENQTVFKRQSATDGDRAVFGRQSASGGDRAVFERLSELHRRWLAATAFPEVAPLLRHPPYGYHTQHLLEGGGDSSRPALAEGSCSADLAEVTFALGSGWALQMLDSDGKPSSGVLRGGLIWPGHFDECNDVYVPKDGDKYGDFHGKYCVTSWNMNLGSKYAKLPLSVGVCVPDSCSAKSLKSAGKTILQVLERLPVLNRLKSIISLTDVTCKQREKSLDVASIIYLVFICGFASLTVVGTVFTICKNRQSSTHVAYSRQISAPTGKSLEQVVSSEDKNSLTSNTETSDQEVEQKQKAEGRSVAGEVLRCFSAVENGARVLGTSASAGQLSSVHGVRFLSLTWVILGHTYISSLAMIGNKIDVLKEMDSFAFQALLQSPFSVDSFFLLSGFLLAYLFFKEADRKQGKINWIYFYAHRFWRLTPAYMVVVFFYLIAFKYFGSGPFWDDHHCDSTRHTWWMYLLYINNFIPISDMCIGWSWYMANDMQFYIISPIFLYALWRKPAIGFGIIGTLLVATWTVTGVLSYKYELIPMFVGVTQAIDFEAYSKKMWDSFDLIYDKPYCRIAPYLIGVLLGYALHKTNQRKNFLNWWQQAVGWTVALFCSLSVVYGLYHVQMSNLTALFYNALCRSAFSLGLAWIIFVCETGHGGFITRLLSWKFFIPLSRLTYCAYLVHPILIHGYYYSYKTAFYFTELVMVTNFMGFMTMAFGLAFVFSLTFESPLMNLEKLLLKGRSR